MSEKKEKWIREVEYRGFDSPEEVKEFLDEIHRDFARIESFFDHAFSGIRRLRKALFEPDLDEEIEWHRKRIEQLEEEKRRALPSLDERIRYHERELERLRREKEGGK